MTIRLTMAAAALVLPLLAPSAMAETRNGTAGRDVLTGRPTASTLNGRGGNDVLYGDPVAGTGKPRKMQRVSVGSKGQQGDKGAIFYALSADGRMLLFTSTSKEFLPAGQMASSISQLFTKDLVTGGVKLISLGGDGKLFDKRVFNLAISPDGKFAAFSSAATNIPGVPLLPTDPEQLMLLNLKTGKFSLVSRSPSGMPGDGVSEEPVFSPDGSKLAFRSLAGNLDPGDYNGDYDVFVVRLSDPSKVFRASTTAAGGLASGGDSVRATFSPDGKSLAFTSLAVNLLGPGVTDKNGSGADVFLKTLGTFDETTRTVRGAVQLVSTDAAGEQDMDGASYAPAFSPDGREIAFISTADSLVLPDKTPLGADILVGQDIYIKTIRAGGPRPVGAIRRVSLAPDGTQAVGEFDFLTYSPDGTRLAFITDAANLAAAANNGEDQVFVKDLTRADGRGGVTLISRKVPNGAQGTTGGDGPLVFQGHGSGLLFTSLSDNLIGNDSNNANDIFLATLAAPTGGNDTLSGGPGKDVLVGGPGADRLTGGKGADIFVYLSTADSRPKLSKRDTIRDFNAKQGDIIDLTAIDANTKKTGNQAFRFIGAKPFDRKPGRLRFANGILSADTNGDGKANFAVKVNVTRGKLTGKHIRK